MAHGFLIKFYTGTIKGNFAYNLVSHRKHNSERRIVLKPKGLALLFVSSELSQLCLKLNVPVSFCQLDTNKSHLERGSLKEELSPSKWPEGMSVGHFLD